MTPRRLLTLENITRMCADKPKGVLLVGNYPDPEAQDVDGRFVITFERNRNNVPSDRIDMVSLFEALPNPGHAGTVCLWSIHYPRHVDNLQHMVENKYYNDFWFIDPLTMWRCYDALGYRDWHMWWPSPTTGFVVLFALAIQGIPVKISGFSWFMSDIASVTSKDEFDAFVACGGRPGELAPELLEKVKDMPAAAPDNHRPAIEYAYTRDTLRKLPNVSFSEQCENYLNGVFSWISPLLWILSSPIWAEI